VPEDFEDYVRARGVFVGPQVREEFVGIVTVEDTVRLLVVLVQYRHHEFVV
jgi:hypothetical protein